MADFKQTAQDVSGSVTEALMDDVAAGEDGNAMTVVPNRIERILACEFVNLSSGPAIIRIRRDATVPPPAAPALDVTDNLVSQFVLPAGAGSQILFRVNIQLDGALSGDALGTAFYVTSEQPDGAQRVSVTLRGNGR